MSRILDSLSFHEFSVLTLRVRKSNHRPLNRKVNILLDDELAKHPKIKSEKSTKNKRNIFRSSPLLDFYWEWQNVARYYFSTLKYYLLPIQKPKIGATTHIVTEFDK